MDGLELDIQPSTFVSTLVNIVKHDSFVLMMLRGVQQNCRAAPINRSNLNRTASNGLRMDWVDFELVKEDHIMMIVGLGWIWLELSKNLKIDWG